MQGVVADPDLWLTRSWSADLTVSPVFGLNSPGSFSQCSTSSDVSSIRTDLWLNSWLPSHLSYLSSSPSWCQLVLTQWNMYAHNIQVSPVSGTPDTQASMTYDPRSSCWNLDVPIHLCTQNGESFCSGKYSFINGAEQILVIRYRVWPDKHTYQQSVYVWPAP